MPESTINRWKEELKVTDNLNESTLHIYQAADQSGDLAQELSGKLKFDILDELYEKNEQLVKDKDAKIKLLENEITNMKVKGLRFHEIGEEVKMNYNEIEQLSYYNKITTNFTTTDTIPVIAIVWKEKYSEKDRIKDKKKLDTWLRYKLRLDTIQIID